MMKFASNRYRFSYLLLGIMAFLFWSFSLPCKAALKVTASNEYKYIRVPDSHFPSDILIRMYIEQVVVNKLNSLHKAITNNEQEKLLNLICSRDIYLPETITSNDYKEFYFAFSNEYLIDKIWYYPVLVFANGDEFPSIAISASRRALLDNKYRKSFRILLIFENNKWVFDDYYFPDLVNYLQLNESDWELPNIEKTAE